MPHCAAAALGAAVPGPQGAELLMESLLLLLLCGALAQGLFQPALQPVVQRAGRLERLHERRRGGDEPDAGWAVLGDDDAEQRSLALMA
jgi:hypothetical protein